MEQHPVPRNISGFQFHLIGDMTIRQFAYLAGGAFSAFFLYKLGPFPDVVKFSLAGICGFTGFAFAFLPIQERPLDKWLAAFIKSINSPTQYVWYKNNPLPEILQRSAAVKVQKTPTGLIQNHNDAMTKLQAYLKTLPPAPQQTLNTMEKSYIDKTVAMFSSPLVYTPQGTKLQQDVVRRGVTPQIADTPLTAPPVTAKSFQPPPKSSPQATIAPPAVASATYSVQTQKTPDHQVLTTPVKDVHAQLSQVTKDKEELLRELELLKRQLKEIQKPRIVKPGLPLEAEKKAPTIKTISAKEAVVEVGMPNLPQTPNIIIGVIKDSQRRIMPNIILTVKDQKGTPLRAFKTNKLGQFASATPLPNGTYLLEVEDPLKRFVFDIAQITLSGKIFLPIEITAKGEREIMREKLAKEIFGSANL